MLAHYLSVLVLAWGPSLACKGTKPPESGDPRWKAELDASMRAFENRKRYRALTVEILQDIPDRALEQAVVDFSRAAPGSCRFERQTQLPSPSSPDLDFAHVPVSATRASGCAAASVGLPAWVSA